MLKSKKIFYNLLWRSSHIFVKSSATLFILLVSIKYLSPEQYGIVTYFTSILTVFLIFCDFGISASVSKFTAEYIALESGKEKKVFASSGFIIIFLAFSLSLLLLLFGSRIFPDYYPQILILLPCFFLSPISSLLDGIYRGHNYFRDLFIRNIYASLATVIVAFLLIASLKTDGALIALTVPPLFFVLSIILARQINLREFDKFVMKDIIKYAWFIGLTNISYFMYTQIDILIMEKFGYMAEIGYYGIIDRIFYFFLLPAIILGQVFAPDVAGLSILKNYHYIKKNFYFTSAAILPFSILITIFIYFIGIILLKEWGGQYNTVSFTKIFGLLSILLPLKIWGSFTVNGFIIPSGNAYIVLIITFIGGISNIIMDLIFIQLYGFIGVFLSTLVVHSLCIICVNLFFSIRIDFLKKASDKLG